MTPRRWPRLEDLPRADCPDARAHDAMARTAPHDTEDCYGREPEEFSGRWTMMCCGAARAYRFKHWILRQPLPGAPR